MQNIISGINLLGTYISALVTFLSVVIVLMVYWLGENRKKVSAARVLTSEIRNAETVIAEIRLTGTVSEASFVLPVENWNNLQHFFMGDLDADELTLINQFYNLSRLIQVEIDRMKSFLPISNEEKIKLVQHKLLDLAEKHKNTSTPLQQGSPYMLEKISILGDLFYQESDWFMPSISQQRIQQYVQSVREISTSTAGAKIKRIAKVK